MLERSRIVARPRRVSGRARTWLAPAAALSALALALTGAGASWGASAYDPALDMNSMYNTTLYTGAQAWWNAGYTGAGVDVAVIDTGVSPGRGPRRARQGRSTAPICRSNRRRRT